MIAISTKAWLSNFIIIGAPRDNSVLLDESIFESGGIYNCTIPSENKTPRCSEIGLDPQGNYSKHSDNQWLGGTIYGNSDDMGSITVCAPRHFFIFNLNGEDQEIMDGNCYELKFNKNENHWEIEFYPHKSEDSSEGCNRYEFSQMGFSLYKDEINRKTIFGEPGALHWDGRASIYTDFEIEHINFLSISENCIGSWSYMGYSVVTGKFDKNAIASYYIIGAPKLFDTGAVLIFDNFQDQTTMKFNLTGIQKYEYFGYSLLLDDLNDDRINELIVSAPLHTEKGRYEIGVIYIFNIESDFQVTNRIIKPPFSRRSAKRFGTAMTRLGDINHDSFNDIAVSAPFGENPVVYYILLYIYFGSSEGLKENPEQILRSPRYLNINSMYGMSLGGRVDVDGNGFNDLVIGAPNADQVFLYLTYPTISIVATFQNLTDEIPIGKDHLFKTFSDVTVKSRYPDNRLTFLSKEYMKVTEKKYRITIESGENNCETNFLLIKYEGQEIMTPFEIEMSYEIVQNPLTEEFCKNCVTVNDHNSKGTIYKKFKMTDTCNDCIPDLKINVTSMEKAYLPKINITSNHKLSFGKIPKFCNEINFVLQCDLWRNDDLYLRLDDSV
ncbi:integrin alpha-PS3-like [Condylostylus longicornis]|uniref:integrin alpha-PS3-like n=1 Tax=Condylostylus longicornis TaxID=2530218 RepID=UPI00244DB766|nr:integrin alpha-PS3-like [Condylostylus longicornis]